MTTLAYTVSGVASAADGAPLVGAEVTLANLDGTRVTRTHTDSDGCYRLTAPGVAATCSSVPAPIDPHAVVVDLTSCETRHDLLLVGRAYLTGIVFAAGRPVAGATVTVINDAAFALANVVTGRDGRYDFDYLAAGGYTVAVRHPDRLPVPGRSCPSPGRTARPSPPPLPPTAGDSCSRRCQRASTP